MRVNPFLFLPRRGDDQARVTPKKMNAFLHQLTPAAAAAALAAACPAAEPANAAPLEAFPVSIQVDAARVKGDLKPIWRFFGADEPNYATMKNGKKLVAELGELRPGEVYFRAHNLLNTGDGVPALKWGSTNAYPEDAQGRPVYDWRILDEIFDTYLARGVRPYTEIGFMPEAMSVHPEPYKHHWQPGAAYGGIGTGWSYPPKDYAKWAELVYQWVRHDIGRYGRAEVEKWYWEVWNEANGESYWHAKPEEFYKLHDYAVDAVRRALPTARVGGPDLAGSGGKFMEDYLAHCVSGTNYATGGRGTPVDFLSFHAKGQPRFVEGHVRLGISSQLGGMDKGFSMFAAAPELKDKPIVIGESDPDGCAACQGPQLGYRTGPIYASYTAACIAREFLLADKHGVNIEGALTWAFEFEDQPIFAGQRVLASNGIDMPVLNVFRMLSKMGGRRVEVASSGEVPLATIIKDGVRGAPDVTALASVEPGRLAILAWHYHDDDVPGPGARVSISVANLPISDGSVRLAHYRIDENHSDAFTVWKRQGSPAAPDAGQYAELEKAGQLARLEGGPDGLPVDHGSAALSFLLPRQAVSLLVLEWDPAAK